MKPNKRRELRAQRRRSKRRPCGSLGPKRWGFITRDHRLVGVSCRGEAERLGHVASCDRYDDALVSAY